MSEAIYRNDCNNITGKGNIRELKNVIERAVILEDEMMTESSLP